MIIVKISQGCVRHKVGGVAFAGEQDAADHQHEHKCFQHGGYQLNAVAPADASIVNKGKDQEDENGEGFGSGIFQRVDIGEKGDMPFYEVFRARTETRQVNEPTGIVGADEGKAGQRRGVDHHEG
jgi:hypothetical protein